MQDWYSFKGETKEFYGVDMTVLEVMIFLREMADARSFVAVKIWARSFRCGFSLHISCIPPIAVPHGLTLNFVRKVSLLIYPTTPRTFVHLGLHCRTRKAVYEEEQRGYYILSSFWAELGKDQVLGEPAVVRTFDMHTCTLEDVQVLKCRLVFCVWFAHVFGGRSMLCS